MPAGLYNAEFHEKLLAGVKVLLPHAQSPGAGRGVMLLPQLPAPSDTQEDSDGDEE